MLSLYKLEIFDAVVQAGSFSGAAQRMYLTQSAVSQHMHSLEASLDARLFTRGRRGVRLTPAGETLYQYTRCILRLLTEAQRAVSGADHPANGQLRIGATPGAGLYMLPEWVQTFRSQSPGFSVTLTTDVTARIASGLLNRALDIGFVEGEIEADRRLRRQELDAIEQFVVVGREHPWYTLHDVRIEQLSGQPFITRPPDSQMRVWLDRILAQHQVVPEIVAEFDNPEAIKQAVISGMGITILPAYAFRRELETRLIHALPVSAPRLIRMLGLLWNVDEPFTLAAVAFLSFLAERYPQVRTLPGFRPLAELAATARPRLCP